MEAKFYQIDAFTDRVFAGNPAGVCFLDERRSGFHRRAGGSLFGRNDQGRNGIDRAKAKIIQVSAEAVWFLKRRRGRSSFHSVLFLTFIPLTAMATRVVPMPTCRAISARGIPSSRYK
jgi:hypothetical protein